MEIEKAMEYLKGVYEDAENEGELQEPMLVTGFIWHFEKILKILQEENEEQDNG